MCLKMMMKSSISPRTLLSHQKTLIFTKDNIASKDECDFMCSDDDSSPLMG